ncbi:S9 family peptidase [Fulvivirga ligni]|uniref:S9 family peptidase n=1 Tax=Fulvivirga ligni TaxID=2904246 RepID=UPI001F24BCAB|nr:DPP IV N-terminal domain-containing protein [Fulvivirga ligni]UII21263.1 S9 family peptidase [Fulvivirga ligni]
MKKSLAIIFCLCFVQVFLYAQDKEKLTIDRIFASNEFQQDYQAPISWIEKGEAYVVVSANEKGENELIKYATKSQKESSFLSSAQLTPKGASTPLDIEDFSLSDDETKILIFTNSKRVWRSNTKGDYWVYDLTTNKLSQLGGGFSASSLMFAKFSGDNKYVAYVMDFNLYMEEFSSGKITQLTTDGTKDIINGTFDWVYEEEFGCRDGFRWSPKASKIAFWQLDASTIGTFYMINNTDSIYSKPIPIQYPKIGQDPSSAKIGIVTPATQKVIWVELEGSTVQNYIPGIQWVSDDLLLIQQINHKQNDLKIWAYDVKANKTRLVYEEKEDTWVDISYPDLASSHWGDNDLILTDGGKSFIRMTEDQWRNVYKINIATGEKVLLTPGNYDAGSIAGLTDSQLYYAASPKDITQRYLYAVDLKGGKKDKRITPSESSGVNLYDISPNGKYALHYSQSALKPAKVELVSLPSHKTIKTLVSNEKFEGKLKALDMPTVEFIKVTTEDNITLDARVIKPLGFDASKKYPVIFHVYGEPWGQVATDNFVGMWNLMLAQKGYIVVDIDPRGTPCLKGSEWRKSIYRHIGRINIHDLGQGAIEILKFPYIDKEKVGVWGWSGGGSSTLNLMFQYPEVFKTGVAVAAVAYQMTYDNIYQERYMGIPQETKADLVAGSPITHAKNLEGNLLVIHGTGDDNVHYQNMELLINELILQNKQFDMMAYPNRSHGIYEGQNTRRHLYTLITNYFMEKMPAED